MADFKMLAKYWAKAVMWKGQGNIETTIAQVSKVLVDTIGNSYHIVTFDAFEDHKASVVAAAKTEIQEMLNSGLQEAATAKLQEILNLRATTRLYPNRHDIPMQGELVEVLVGPGSNGKNYVRKVKRLNNIESTELGGFTF
jgi:hypothetical protein